MSTNVNAIRDLAERDYKWGFVTDIEHEQVPKGLSEETIRVISAKKQEPEFMLDIDRLIKIDQEPVSPHFDLTTIEFIHTSSPKTRPLGLRAGHHSLP